MPTTTHAVAMQSGSDGKPPSEGVMRRRLFAKLQAEIASRLGKVEGEAFQECLRRGTWASDVLLPGLGIRYESHTDGFAAVAIAGVPRQAIADAARASLVRRGNVFLEARLAELRQTASSPWVMRESAYEDMLARHRNVSAVLDELALAALALLDRPEGEKVPDGQLADAVKIVNRAAEFREYLGCRILQGNSPNANLGSTIPTVEFQLVWQGRLAAGLPVRPVLSGLGGAVSRQTDELGVVRIEFTEPARFTGMPANEVGFELDWDGLSLFADTGLASPPWTTSVVLPSAGNTLVYVSLTERVRGVAIDGPIRAGLVELLKDAGMAFTLEPPGDAESRFVLEISGVVHCDELESSRSTAIRQIRSQGSVSLQAYKGNLLATLKPIQGVASWTHAEEAPVKPAAEPKGDQGKPLTKEEREAKAKAEEEARKAAEEARKKRDAEIEAAGRRALEDAWVIWRRNIVREFRVQFPPLFRMDAER